MVGKSVKTADSEAREKMHNASTMVGMAFANAFLGMRATQWPKIGAVHHTVPRTYKRNLASIRYPLQWYSPI